MNKQPTVADYIVRRLAREGITDCFGVAGDFAFKLDDAVVRSDAIRWIGCSNELDAAYAADGYARVRGCSLLCYHVRRRRVVRAQRRDGGEGRAVVRVPPGGHADDAQSAGRQDHPPYPRRRSVPEFREYLRTGGMCFGRDHSRQLRPRNGTADRLRRVRESRPKPIARCLRLCHYPGYRFGC